LHPNEQLLRREYQAFAAADLETLASIFTDDIVYHIPGRNPLSGAYVGRDEVFSLFRRDRTVSFESELHDVIATTRTRWR
jgi:uncharacterized protein